MPKNRTSQTLFVLDYCPLCTDHIFVLRSLTTNQFIFVCTLDGVAWSNPPTQETSNEWVPLKQFGLSSLALPTKEEIDNANLSEVEELSSEAELKRLEPYIRF